MEKERDYTIRTPWIYDAISLVGMVAAPFILIPALRSPKENYTLEKPVERTLIYYERGRTRDTPRDITIIVK